jgi:hypothetical protein
METITHDSPIWDDNGVKALTKEQAIICSVVTGMVFLPMRHVRMDVSRRMGREVKLTEFSNPAFVDEVRALYRSDFLKIVVNDPMIERI